MSCLLSNEHCLSGGASGPFGQLRFRLPFAGSSVFSNRSDRRRRLAGKTGC